MKNRNSGRIIAALLFVTVVIASGILFLYLKSKSVSKNTELKMFYYDPVSMELVPDNVVLSLSSNPSLRVQEILKRLTVPPINSGLFPVLNKESKTNSVSVKNGICTIDLDESATFIKPLNVRKEVIRVYGIVNTLTDIPGINAVQILINGKKQQYFSHYIRIDGELTHLSSVLPSGKDVNLYFVSPDFTKLLLEKREIIASRDPSVLGKETLSELLFGSTKGLKSLFPADVKIENFYIKSGGIGVVDFNPLILKHPLGSHEEQMLVMSLVNSLTELPDIQSVQILIGGKQISTLFGSVDTSVPILRFFGITQDDMTIVPYYVYTVNSNMFFCPTIEVAKTGQKRINALFKALKYPPEGLKTYVPISVKLNSYTVKKDNSMLYLNISCTVNGSSEIKRLEREIALSFTEISGISRVEVQINGGTEVILSR